VVNKYLCLAFCALWVIFFVYVWLLSRRLAHLRKEIEELKSQVAGSLPSDLRPS
jgi:CcmD family protein